MMNEADTAGRRARFQVTLIDESDETGACRLILQGPMMNEADTAGRRARFQVTLINESDQTGARASFKVL
jgi:hypothetical protein